MDAKELLKPDGKPSGVFMCSRCRLVYSGVESAERCCCCTFCGEEVVRKEGQARCHYHQACWDKDIGDRYKAQLDKAEEIPNYDGWVFCEHGGPKDGYAESLQEMVEWWDDQIAEGDVEAEDYPEFVFACTEHPPRKIDSGDLIDMLADGGYDDMADDIELPEGLDEMLKKFNELNAHLVSYDPDHKRKVKMPPLEFDQDQLEKETTEPESKESVNP